jgi:hypothetical protein
MVDVIIADKPVVTDRSFQPDSSEDVALSNWAAAWHPCLSPARSSDSVTVQGVLQYNNTPMFFTHVIAAE